MKKLILFLLVASNIICADYVQHRSTIYIHNYIPLWQHDDAKVLPFALGVAALSAKDTEYETDYYEGKDLIICRVYNYNSLFSLRFNVHTRECIIEFNSSDDTIDYFAFHKIIDFFFVIVKR